jgi:hypothetical protein
MRALKKNIAKCEGFLIILYSNGVEIQAFSTGTMNKPRRIFVDWNECQNCGYMALNFPWSVEGIQTSND